MNPEKQPEMPHIPGAHNAISECQTSFVKGLILASISLSTDLAKQYPELNSVFAKSKRALLDWEFFFIAAGTGLALRDPRCSKSFCDAVLKDASLCDHQMMVAIENLNGFVDSRDESLDILPATGVWVLWNIAQECPSHEESKALAPAIGVILNKILMDCLGEQEPWRK